LGRLDRAEGGELTPHGGAGGKDDDFFDSWDDVPNSGRSDQGLMSGGGGGSGGASGTGLGAGNKGKPAKKADGWDQEDEWKDF
jgi:hypothetical protein